jgi:hypothetical protein
MSNFFLENLMKEIVDEGMLIPKFQVERCISPILSLFLENILETKFPENQYELIMPEFPIRKGMLNGENDNQSTNIDYLLFNKTENKFTFLELKTDSKSYKYEQLKIYFQLQKNVMNLPRVKI